jgi:PAS domain S-box-containing protein
MDIFQSIVSQFPDAIILSDTRGVIKIFNNASVSMFGIPQEEAVGSSLDIIIPEPYREAHWKGFYAAVQNKKMKHQGKVLPTKARKADGTTFYVSLSFSLVFDSLDESPVGVMACARDI